MNVACILMSVKFDMLQMFHNTEPPNMIHIDIDCCAPNFS